MLKHVIGAFYYHFWSTMWPRIGKNTVNDISSIKDLRSKRLIRQTLDAIEAFINFGCIATGMREYNSFCKFPL